MVSLERLRYIREFERMLFADSICAPPCADSPIGSRETQYEEVVEIDFDNNEVRIYEREVPVRRD